MKKISMLLVALLIVSTYTVSYNVEAENKVSIFVNEVEQSYSDKAMFDDGNTLVPLRGIFEALGAEVIWNNSTWTIDATKGSTKIWLEIGSKITKVNGKTVNIAAAPRIVDGITLVPLRFISEALGAEVLWDGSTMTININLNDDLPINPEPVQPPIQTPVQLPIQTPVQPPVKKTVEPPIQTPVEPPVQTIFKNCTELKEVYPNGVAKGHPAYQDKMDRDKDGWACE